MSREHDRRLSALEKGRRSTLPRYAVLWGEHRLAVATGDAGHLPRVAWVKPDNTCMLILPHNGRDQLEGQNHA